MPIPSLLIIFFLALFATLIALFWVQRIKLKHVADGLVEHNRALMALRVLDQVILTSVRDLDTVVQEIVNIVPKELHYVGGIISLIDEEAGGLRRTAISRTPEIEEILKEVPVPFNQQVVLWSATENIMIRAIKENKSFVTYHLADLSYPALPREVGESIQKRLNVKANVVYPIMGSSGILGTIFFSTSKNENEIFPFEREIMQGFAQEVGIAIENAILYKKLQERTSQLSMANQKLKELDKLKDDFVSVASHELRTPMTAIRSYSWMALNRPDITLSEKMKKYLSRTLISTERLINLVNDMLNVSRIEAGRIEIKPSIFDIQTLVDDVIAEVTPKANEKMVRLEVEKSALPKVFADPDKVHQVLLNLIGNSLKFTPVDGLIQINFLSDGKMIEISVTDNGVGISKEDLSRLFQKFGRLDNSYVAAATSGGTGLGLFISKSLVELMHGIIKASSDGQGKGATFTFSLPIATPETVAQSDKFTKKPVGEAKVLEPAAI